MSCLEQIDELFKAIQILIESDALEIYTNDDSISIPYMMNDAVEYYYTLSNCVIKGQWENQNTKSVSCHLEENEGKPGLIFVQSSGNVFTIWFETVKKHLELYQYHEIGHFWVKGQELFRRLVYIVGTIHDKYTFLGEGFCNKEELELLYLMEFAPFRYYSPIHDSLDDFYCNSYYGLETMKKISDQICDKTIDKMLIRYESAFVREKLYHYQVKRFAKTLLKSKAFYRFMDDKIKKASLSYGKRIYDEKEMDQIKTERIKAQKKMQEAGFTGEYPFYQKGKKCMVCYEEHPYVARDFEYENYSFSITAIECEK